MSEQNPRARSNSKQGKKKRPLRRWLGLLIAAIALTLALVIYLALAVVSSHRRLTDGCTTTASIDTAAVASIQWRVPLGQPYVVATTTNATELDLAPVDTDGDAVGGPVLSAQAGTVVATTATSVTLDQGSALSMTYSGLTGISIKKGAQVGDGQVIGKLNPGAMVKLTGTQNGKSLDPKTYLASQGVNLDGKQPPAPISQDDQTATGSNGAGFNLPAPGDPRNNSLNAPPISVPSALLPMYQAAGKQYGIPWTLLAGIGMEETSQGNNRAVSSVGAQGLMQFMPATFQSFGVDGDGDGKTDINDDADSIFTAAHYLVASGATQGAEGVQKALRVYNNADWYVNDVLYYAAAYGGGTVTATPTATAAAGCADSTAEFIQAEGPVSPGQLAANLQQLVANYPSWAGSYIDPGSWYSGECVSWAGYFVRTMYPKKYGDFSNHYKGVEFGDAKTWHPGALAAGLPENSTPAVGSIAVRTSGSAGHVAAVIAVNKDGSFTVAEYNFSAHHQFGIRTNVTVGSGSGQFNYFIHFEK